MKKLSKRYLCAMPSPHRPDSKSHTNTSFMWLYFMPDGVLNNDTMSKTKKKLWE